MKSEVYPEADENGGEAGHDDGQDDGENEVVDVRLLVGGFVVERAVMAPAL